MIRVQRAILFFFVVLIAGVACSSAADNPYSVETKPPRGFMPTADQLASPVDSVEPVSGKVHVEIPLASLPRGRAGSGFDLNLVYDSHLYDLEPEALSIYSTPSEYQYMLPMTGYNLIPQGTTGGWHYNVDNLKFDEEVYEGTTGESPCPDGAPGMNYRLRVGLLDGSLHTMILKEWAPADRVDLLQQGWAGIAPFVGTSNACAQAAGYPAYYTGWLTYYSIDGSYLKLETYVTTAYSTSNPFTLYLPDGRRLAGHGSNFETIVDANGNAIHLTHGCNDTACNQLYTAITDDTGRQIQINPHVDYYSGGGGGNSIDTITAPGPNGDMTTTVNWETLELGANNSRTYLFSNAPWFLTKSFHFSIPAVQYVQLPLTAAVAPSTPPPVWNSYAFQYAGDPNGWGEIASMRTPSGMQVAYNWNGSPESPGGVNGGTQVVQRAIIHDGISNDLVWGYSYASDKTTITNPDSSQTLYWHGPQSGYLDSSIGDNLGVGDVVYRIDEPNGHVQKRMWSQNRTGLLWTSSIPGVQNPWVRRETTTIGNASGAPSLTAVTDRMIDKNGNLLQTTEYDWVSYNASGPETGSTVKRTTQFTYYVVVPSATSTPGMTYEYWYPNFSPLSTGSPRRLDAVRRKEVSDGSGNKAAVTEFVYDDELRAGNVTAENHWDSVKASSAPSLGALSTSNSKVLTRAYDAYGNVTDYYEPQIRTHITYDSYGNPTRVDYAYGTADQRSWGYTWDQNNAGTLTTKTDLDNNVSTTYTYDAVGRQLTIIEAGLRKTETIYDDANLKVTVKKDLSSFGDGKLQAFTQYDQLGRSVQTQTTEPGNSGGIKVKSAYYPAVNRTVKSNPYRTMTDATLEWTCTQTDASKRVTAVAMFKGSEPTDCETTTNRTGITRTVYDSNLTTVTDPAGRARSETADALGRLVQVNEDPSNLNYVTMYQYDTLNNLHQTSQVDGTSPQATQTRTFNYSSLGRLLSAANPESGLLQYTYLDSGDLATKTDARNFATTFGYDGQHRVVSKSYFGDNGLTPNVTYAYFQAGAAAPNIGQLHSVAGAGATVSYSNYDALGRAQTNSQTVNGATYMFQYSYRLNDGLSTMQYPSGKTVSYSVDDAGRLNQVSTSSKNYADLTASSAPFTADGRIAQIKLGNDLWETRVYQPPGSPTFFKLGTSAGANDKLELEYDYSSIANNGNLSSHVIRQPGHTWTQSYTYDALNRISAASEASGFSRTYGYDRFGNRWVASSSGITAADSHEPTVGTLFDKTNNRLANQAYDAAGNLTSYDPRTLSYDAENRMISATSSSNGNESFVYDGDGHRVRKLWTPSGGSQQITTYVYGPNGHVAAEYTNQSVGSSTTFWMFTDLLGSVRAVTGDKPQSGTASITECYDYLPFGRMLSSSDNDRNTGCYPSSPDYSLTSAEAPKFTGKERDIETGLDYFGARYFSSAQGRFMVPDWSQTLQPIPYADLTDPQTLNLYSYVRNTPLSHVDTDGHQCDTCQMIWNWLMTGHSASTAASVAVGQGSASNGDLTASAKALTASARASSSYGVNMSMGASASASVAEVTVNEGTHSTTQMKSSTANAGANAGVGLGGKAGVGINAGAGANIDAFTASQTEKITIGPVTIVGSATGAVGIGANASASIGTNGVSASAGVTPGFGGSLLLSITWNRVSAIGGASSRINTKEVANTSKKPEIRPQQ